MKYSMQDFKTAVELLMRHKDLKSVTVFSNPLKPFEGRVRGTIKRKANQIILTFSKPNSHEQEHIRKVRKSRLLLPKVLMRYSHKK